MKWSRKPFPFPLSEGRKRPAVWRVAWRHPRQRFVMIEYRVRTMCGNLSQPIRECFWTQAAGVGCLTVRPRKGYRKS